MGAAGTDPSVSQRRKNADSARTINQSVGRRVRAIRMTCGHSQEHVAQLLNLSFQQVQKFESGSSRISPDKLLSIARYYDMPIAWFFDDVPADLRPSADVEGAEPAESAKSHHRLRLEVGRELQYVDETLLRPLLELLRSSRRDPEKPIALDHA